MPAMLAVTLIHIGILFIYGNPEWKPIATTYLGLLLFGGCFISVGLLISSLTKNQIVAGVASLGVFLLLWIIDWMGTFAGPTVNAVLTCPLDHRPPRGLHERRPRHDAPHLLPELHRFRPLPDRESVDTERWRG